MHKIQNDGSVQDEVVLTGSNVPQSQKLPVNLPYMTETQVGTGIVVGAGANVIVFQESDLIADEIAFAARDVNSVNHNFEAQVDHRAAALINQGASWDLSIASIKATVTNAQVALVDRHRVKSGRRYYRVLNNDTTSHTYNAALIKWGR